MGIRKFLVGTATVASVLALTAMPAFAAGNGYAPPGSSSSGSGGAGFTAVLAAQTVDSTGGTLTATSSLGDATVSIPAGTFSTPVQVSVTSGNQTSLASDVPNGDSLLTAFGVNFTGATPNKPITLTITNSAIPANAEVFKVTSSGLVKMNATVTAGKVTITFQNDPDFVVVKPKTGNVPLATSPVTGLPIAEELGGGLGIVIVGAAMILFSMRRREN